MTDKSYKYDVFLSYGSVDAPVVREIAKALRDSGLRIWLGEWISHPPDDTAYQIENALSNSRVLLLFVSKAVLGIQWQQMEKQTFKFRDPINPERRFIPVRLDEASLPETLRQLEHVEWREEQAGEVLARLIAVCAPPEPKPTARGSAVARSTPRNRYRLNPSSPIRALNFQLSSRSAVYGTLETV